MKHTETELLTLLKNEANEATGYYDSELAKLQADAQDAYFSRAYGDEVDNRSKFVTSDVSDKINWLMPTLKRIFARNDDLITIKPLNEKTEKQAKEAAKYLDHVLFNDNKFDVLLGTFAKDGLLNKIGVCQTSWVKDTPNAPKEYKNIPPDRFQEFHVDDEFVLSNVEMIVDGQAVVKEFTEEEATALYESGVDVKFNATIQKVSTGGKVIITPLKPESFLISKLAESIDDATYVGSRETVYKSEIAKQYPKKKSDIMSASTDFENNDIDNDERTQARFYNESNDANDENPSNPRATLHSEFIRYDYDGDGYVELLHVKRIGDVILETMPVDESNFSAWCPIPVPHKFYGQSIAEITMPMQRVRTVLFRSGIDNVIASSRPQHAVNLDTLADEGFDQLYNQEIGAPLMFEGTPDIQTIALPDMSGAVMGQLELTDRMLDARTGVKSDAMGVDSTSIHNTAHGQDQLTQASDIRKEDVAFELGLGIEDIARKAFKLLCLNQDYVRQLKVKGKWIDFDPRVWSDDMAVSIHAGMSAGNKQTQVSGLMNTLQIQQTIMNEAGVENQWVSPDQINNTLAELSKAQGYSNPELFFKPIPTEEEQAAMAQKQAQTDPRSPEQIAADGKVQVDMQTAQAKSQQNFQQMQSEQQVKTMTAQSDMARKDQLAAADIERADVKLSAELTMQNNQLNAEVQMKQNQTVAEFKLGAEVKSAELKLNKDVKQEELNQKVNLTDVHIGGDASK